MTTLNPLAVANAPLLHKLASIQLGTDEAATVSDIARAIGRDESNVRKSIKALAVDGLVDTESRALTPAGFIQLAAIDRAEGQGGEPGSQPSVSADGMLALYHAQILPDPGNARRDWDSDEAKADLDALREDLLLNGLLQNLVVRAVPEGDLQGVSIERTDDAGARHVLPLYRLIGGERRWRAIAIAISDGDWPEDRLIPCRELDTDDLGCRLAALAENIQRRNLNPIEKARAFEGLAEAGLSNQQIAERIVATPEHVQQHRRFLQLDEADQQRMTLSKDDPRHLSVRDARSKLARKGKSSLPPAAQAIMKNARSEPAPAAAPTPPPPELTPTAVVRLHEIADWIDDNPSGNGHGFETWALGRALNAEEDLLIAGGHLLADIEGDQAAVYLTGLGQRYVRDNPAPGEAAFREENRLAAETAKADPAPAEAVDTAAIDALAERMRARAERHRQRGGGRWTVFPERELARQLLDAVGNGQIERASVVIAWLMAKQGGITERSKAVEEAGGSWLLSKEIMGAFRQLADAARLAADPDQPAHMVQMAARDALTRAERHLRPIKPLAAEVTT